jgi:hypothetical protein
VKEFVVSVALCSFALSLNAGESSKPVKKTSAATTTQEVQRNLETPESLFTLPTPKYKLPKDIQNLVMFAITTDTRRESVLRDEYKTIYLEKKKLKSWLSGALEYAISVRIGANTDEINEASRRQDVYALTRALDKSSAIRNESTPRWERWQAYVKSNW